MDQNKIPLKISGKVPVGVVRDSQKFSGHPYIGRIMWSSLQQLSFLVLNSPAISCFTGEDLNSVFY